MFSIHNAEYVMVAYGITIVTLAAYLGMIWFRFKKVKQQYTELNKKEL